jgi:hypothetical protein
MRTPQYQRFLQIARGNLDDATREARGRSSGVFNSLLFFDELVAQMRAAPVIFTISFREVFDYAGLLARSNSIPLSSSEPFCPSDSRRQDRPSSSPSAGVSFNLPSVQRTPSHSTVRCAFNKLLHSL